MGTRKKGRGRPTKFNNAMAYRLLVLYTQGKTDAQVASDLGISTSTLFYWKSLYEPDFSSALKEAKSVADDLVESALFNRAVGYTVEEEKVFCTKGGEIVTHQTLKHYPPDVVACIFWLKNRRPKRWREKSIDAIDAETIRTIQGKRSFEEFCERAGYPRPFPKQVEMKDFVIRGGEERISDPRMLLGSRGIGKSEYSTILGLGYEIYCDPNDTTILSTKVEKNGRRMLKALSRALEANGVQITINNADEIRVAGCQSKEHNVMLVPVGSSGFRTMHPKRVLFDDPVVPGSTSEADREELKVAYEEAIKLTKNVAIIGQPVDFRDLYAYLRGIIKTMEVPHGTIPELDHDLDVQRAAGVEEKSIQASYFLKVEPEGDATFHDIERIDSYPIKPSIGFLDPSGGGDTTALGIFTDHFQGMAIAGFAWKKGWHNCVNEIREACIKYKIHKLGFETNMFGVLPLQVLRENLHDIGVSIEGKYTHSNKEARIQLAARFSKSLYLSKDSNPEYTRQVIEYSHDAKYDDAPDTIATFLEWAGKIRPPKAVKKPSGDL